MSKPLTFRDPYRTRASSDGDGVHVYLYAEGRGTLQEFLDHVDEVTKGNLTYDEISVAPGTTLWTEPATEAELARWAESDAGQKARTEEWERRTLVRLSAKYAPPAAPPPPAGDDERGPA